MNSRKKARREQTKPGNKAQTTPVWADDAGKDSEEEQLEELLFGGAAIKQNLKQRQPAQGLTGLEHVPDSEVSEVYILRVK